MKKSDLKDGMIVQTGEDFYLVCDYKFLSLNGYMGFSDYDENLKMKDEGFEKFNINFVYKTKSYGLGLKELLSETKSLEKIWERPREIDWSKVPEWTKVQVRDCKNQKWRNRYFSRYNPYKETPYIVSAFDKFIFDDRPKFEGTIKSYRQCRIHPSVEIPKEWYKE